ncbi:MAG: hypothetical protein DRJ15_01380 [Bacteroidetes bacterium]|nr:MAG: hypothetical protein DRJ15_01380 [Bacteroidota bacterium]
MRHFISILFILSLCTPPGVIAQTTYFNSSYNPNNTFAIATSILEYDDDFYISGGTWDSIYGNRAIFIGKVNPDGNLEYFKTYEASPFQYWSGYTNSLISTEFGHLILAGHRGRFSDGSREATYYNFNINGDTNFTRYYPNHTSSDYISFNQCRRTSDNGFVFVGNMTVEPTNLDVLIIKTNYFGQEEWRANYSHIGVHSIDQGYNILQTEDGGYLVGLYYYSTGMPVLGDPYLMKVDEQGGFEWEINLGGPYSDFLLTVCNSRDGNYMCAASIADTAMGDLTFTKVNISKISPNGEILWTRSVGGQHLWNKVHGIYQDHNDGYVLCGFRHDSLNSIEWMSSCGWICKIDENGDSIWWREYEHFDDPEFHLNSLYDIHLTSDGGYVAVGQTATIYDPQQVWVLKVDSFGCDTPGCNQVGLADLNKSKDATKIEIFPNPATKYVNIRYSLLITRYSILIYDMFGRLMEEIIVPSGQEEKRLDVSSYPAGLYIAVVKNNSSVFGRMKFVVTKQ